MGRRYDDSVILTWEETFRAGPSRCGGKGFNLARLHRYGFPVPRGGVLPADVYTNFIRPFNVERVTDTEALRAEIERARLPDNVRDAIRAFLPGATIAVRSSAAAEDGAKASFAGMHRSVLDVRDADARERAVLACYASLWTPQAIAYRGALGIPDQDVPCAVVLCEMVPSVVAGVAFSCDPRSGRRDMVVINAAPGLGERVVSGAVNPDHIEIRLSSGRAEVLHRTGTVLTADQEVELALAVERIHWALGDGQDPQDVEWAHDGRRFWFLQSRPVTRVPRHTFEPAKARPLYWSTANIKDAVPGVVSMLAWSLINEALEDLLYAAPNAAKYPIPPGMQIVKRIDGRAYFDLTAILWSMFDFGGLSPERIAVSIGGHQPTIPVPPGDPLAGPEGKRRRRALRRVAWRLLSLPRSLKRGMKEQFRAVREILDAQPRTKEEIRAAFERLGRLHAEFNPIVGLTNGYGDGLRDLIITQFGPLLGDHPERLLTRLAAGSGGVSSAEQGYRIEELAAAARREPGALEKWKSLPAESPFRRELDRFLADFGHRAVYEADLFNPRWGDDPTYILDQVRAHLDLEPVRRDAARRIRDEAWKELKGKIPFWKRPVLALLLSRMRWGYAARENAKSAMAASMWPTRRLAIECGRLMNLPRPDLAFHLCTADLRAWLSGAWDGAGAATLALDREARREAWLKLPDPPDVVVEGGVLPLPAPAGPLPDGAAWSGIAVSSGRAEGRARLVRHPADGAMLAKGEILIAPSTDPGWTPLFLRAGGLVMETGGYLSHGAIVAREYGLPAVVNVPGVMTSVRDGESLVVDGDRGLVFRMKTLKESDSPPRHQGHQ